MKKKTFEGEKKKVCLLLKIEHTYFLFFSDIFISFIVIIEKIVILLIKFIINIKYMLSHAAVAKKNT